MFNRAKQFTEERLGKAERTENDEAFENMATRSDKIKGYTEKLVKNTEAVLVPNPAARLETMMFDNVPMDKVGVTNTRMSNLEYLGADMIEAGNEFSSGTPYGSALIRVGQTEQGKNNSSNSSAHCLGMSFYVNCFWGGLGSNEFHIKSRFGTHGS